MHRRGNTNAFPRGWLTNTWRILSTGLCCITGSRMTAFGGEETITQSPALPPRVALQLCMIA